MQCTRMLLVQFSCSLVAIQTIVQTNVQCNELCPAVGVLSLVAKYAARSVSQPSIHVYPELSKHLKGRLGPASVTFVSHRGPCDRQYRHRQHRQYCSSITIVRGKEISDLLNWNALILWCQLTFPLFQKVSFWCRAADIKCRAAGRLCDNLLHQLDLARDNHRSPPSIRTKPNWGLYRVNMIAEQSKPHSFVGEETQLASRPIISDDLNFWVFSGAHVLRALLLKMSPINLEDERKRF